MSRGKEGTDWYNEKGAGHRSELSWVEENDETLFLGHIKRKQETAVLGGFFFFFGKIKTRVCQAIASLCVNVSDCTCMSRF